MLPKRFLALTLFAALASASSGPLRAQSTGYADVSIVNLLGVEVAHLFSGELAAGNHSFTWDADRIAAPRGMYECLVRMNERVEILPMVLAR
ncbi:MAG TPA: hypothetical protein VFH95_02325 [Candidatus Kapabacteria bacterium]|nr:hypothetical protein [Candidatus Kapabacteria bacterium]